MTPARCLGATPTPGRPTRSGRTIRRGAQDRAKARSLTSKDIGRPQMRIDRRQSKVARRRPRPRSTAAAPAPGTADADAAGILRRAAPTVIAAVTLAGLALAVCALEDLVAHSS